MGALSQLTAEKKAAHLNIFLTTMSRTVLQKRHRGAE